MKKGSKKALFGIGLSVMTMGASLLVGCSPVDDVRGWVDQIFCKHETKEIVEAVAATCTEDGYTEYEKCLDCGKEVTKGAVIKAKGHKFEVTKGYAATCTTLGLTEGKQCSACGEVKEKGKPIPALGHKLKEMEAYAATCETDGFTGGVKCENCDYALSGENIPALGHSYDDGAVTKEATCETDGEKTFTCATCEGTKVEIISATGHGYQDGTCTVCGATENAVREEITFSIDGTSYTALSGMTWGEWVESEYNTASYYIVNNFVKSAIGNTVADIGDIDVGGNKIIVGDVAYSFTKEK